MSDAAATGRLLASIAESSHDAIVSKDLAGNVTSWNPAAETLFGYTAAEMIGQPITRIFPPDRLHEETTILQRVGRGEILSHFETERMTKDGRTIPVSVTISPVRDPSGRIVGVSKIARGLSESQALMREVRRREALLQSILETVPDALILIDSLGKIRGFSHAAERMFGFTAEEALGRNVSMLMPPEHAAAHDAHLKRYVTTLEKHIIGTGRVITGRRRDGTIFPMELQVGEVLTAGSHLFTGFVRDLTERQDRERRLAELQSELIHVSRLSDLGQMVSAIAHEVNQRGDRTGGGPGGAGAPDRAGAARAGEEGGAAGPGGEPGDDRAGDRGVGPLRHRALGISRPANPAGGAGRGGGQGADPAGAAQPDPQCRRSDGRHDCLAAGRGGRALRRARRDQGDR
jgi:PAS domain S-box-containing protein